MRLADWSPRRSWSAVPPFRRRPTTAASAVHVEEVDQEVVYSPPHRSPADHCRDNPRSSSNGRVTRRRTRKATVHEVEARSRSVPRLDIGSYVALSGDDVGLFCCPLRPIPQSCCPGSVQPIGRNGIHGFELQEYM